MLKTMLSLFMITAIVGCGGGGNSNKSAETFNNYTTLSDIENKTLQLTIEIKGDVGIPIYLDMGDITLGSNYSENGILLLDVNNYAGLVKGCGLSNDSRFKYVCTELTSSGHVEAYVLNISDSNKITGYHSTRVSENSSFEGNDVLTGTILDNNSPASYNNVAIDTDILKEIN